MRSQRRCGHAGAAHEHPKAGASEDRSERESRQRQRTGAGGGRGMSGAKINVGRAVDWGFAATVGAKLVRPGPAATDYTRRQVIDQLTESSRSAELPVREGTGLNEGGEIP